MGDKDDLDSLLLEFFFAFLRIGELTVPSDTTYDPNVHLSVKDIAVDKCQSPSLLRITLKQSKTDPYRKGVDLFAGHTSSVLCPMSALWSYMQKRGVSPGLLFQYKDGRPLTRKRFVAAFRVGLRQIGIDDKLCDMVAMFLGQVAGK